MLSIKYEDGRQLARSMDIIMSMNVSRDFVPYFRQTNGLKIYFKDKHTVAVHEGSSCTVFHRWADRHPGDYRKWFNFCRTLKRRNTLASLYDCGKVANYYGIESLWASRPSDYIPPENTKVLPERHNYYGKH